MWYWVLRKLMDCCSKEKKIEFDEDTLKVLHAIYLETKMEEEDEAEGEWLGEEDTESDYDPKEDEYDTDDSFINDEESEEEEEEEEEESEEEEPVEEDIVIKKDKDGHYYVD